MFSKKNQVCFADGLKVKTWWVAAELVSQKVTIMCDFSIINCSFFSSKVCKIYKLVNNKSKSM